MSFSGVVERIAERISRADRLQQVSNGFTRARNAVDARIRALQATPAPAVPGRGILTPSVREKYTPWSSHAVPPCDIPGMISEEECRYYSFIGKYYTGVGEVVELGPWLGRSTFYIVAGLANNPHFRKLHVFDDFTWRAAWMDKSVKPEERLPHHADFMPLFEKYTQGIRDKIMPKKRKFITYDGNDSVEQLAWNGGPVEILYVDCGRHFEANEAWWRIFQPYLIPDVTLIVLEDWANHREVPVKWYNQIVQWVESKGSSLQLIHELTQGGIATFVYRQT